MRIGIVGASFAPGKTGGIETLFRTLVASLDGHEPENEYRLYIRPQYVDEFKGLAPHFTVVPLEETWGLWDRARRRVFGAYDILLGRFLERQAVDVLHFPFTTMSPRGLTKKTVLTFCDMQQEFFPEFFSAEDLRHRERTYRASAHEADRVIAISDYTRRTLIETYDLPAERVTTVHPTYDERLFTRHVDVEVTEGRPYFFYPAGRWPHKNHRRLLRAFRRVAEQYSEAQLKLTGLPIPWEDKSLRSEISELGLEDNVEFLSYVAYEDLPALYRNAIALVFPSLFEGFGIPLLEAMAMGCPIACSNTTSLPEAAGDAAVYFNPQSELEISATMIELLRDQALRDDLSRAGLQRVQRFTAERMAGETREVYSAVHASGAPTGQAFPG